LEEVQKLKLMSKELATIPSSEEGGKSVSTDSRCEMILELFPKYRP
jgi:hypothetical protein